MSALSPFRWFLGRIRHYWSGNGNPFILLAVWWALLNIAAFGSGSVVLAFFSSVDSDIRSADIPFYLPVFFCSISGIFSLLGLIIAFVYPVIFAVSSWRCAANTAYKWLTPLLRILFVLLLWNQLHLSLIYFVGSMSMWMGCGMALGPG